ncbi:reverse transcriptase [Tanacetum coccineum]
MIELHYQILKIPLDCSQSSKPLDSKDHFTTPKGKSLFRENWEGCLQAELSDYAKVHPVFHVSQLKPCYIDSAVMGSFQACDSEGLLAVTPFKLLDRRMVKHNNRMVVFGLIQWSNRSEEDATWEKLKDLLARFLEFSLDP